MIFLELLVCILIIWVYQMLYEGEPWYEHMLFWSVAIGLAILYQFY